MPDVKSPPDDAGSPPPSPALIGSLQRAIGALQDATDEVDAAAADRMGLNRTDLRCVSLIFSRGTMSAKELAGATRITPGALTTALDRLERAGYLTRVRLHNDRRRVLIRLTPAAEAMIAEIWGPIGAEAGGILTRYDDSDLRVILDFLERAIELQVRHAARIRVAGSAAGERAGGPAAGQPAPADTQ